MLVLLFYYWYKEEKMKFWMLCLVYFILIWFSNPVAFFSGGVVAYEVLKAMWKKDKQNFWRGMVLGITICVSFLIMYIVWLKPTIATTNLSEFWEGYEFPFWVGSMKELKWAIHLIAFVTQGAGTLWKVILLLAAAAVLLNIIVVRNDYIWALTLGIVITLVASHFGFFPMSVILDPPAFTKSREATKNAIKGYREINMKGMKLVKDGGYLATCSCSHFMTQELLAKTVKEAAKAVHKRLRQVEFRTQSPDHPILWAADESYYLKFFVFQVVEEH